MSLRKKQSRFVWMVAQLIFFALSKGHEITFGDAWATVNVRRLKKLSFLSRLSDEEFQQLIHVVLGHKKRSKHYDRLAIDLNLFKDGKWLRKTEDHRPLGAFWVSLGGTWGGDWGDGNHYQL